MSPHPLLAHLLYFVCVCVVGVGVCEKGIVCVRSSSERTTQNADLIYVCEREREREIHHTPCVCV